MIIQGLTTLRHSCELERTQLLAILAMSLQIPKLASYFLTGDRSKFLYVEAFTAWLYYFPQFTSPLYEADKCFDHIPTYYQDTVMHFDPITRQIFN